MKLLRRALLGISVLLALAALVWWYLPVPTPTKPAAPVSAAPQPEEKRPSSPLPLPPPAAGRGTGGGSPAAAKGPMHLEVRADSLAESVVREVERVTRPRQCRLALATRGDARLACLIVEGDDYYYQLDSGLRPEDFACLRQFDFQEPPPPLQKTLSIYRSLSKTALGYRASAGDRLIILLCPKRVWPELKLECINFNPL